MVYSLRVKDWISWPLFRAHLCTLAVAVGFNSTWRAPRDAFRFGGLQYALVFSVAMLTVALPVTLLQLAVGQLSQQDAVGVWRAVPFFRGVGYVRLLISLLGSVYTQIYLAMTITYFLYTTSHSIPFSECIDIIFSDEDYTGSDYACLEETFMAPVSSKPEYYLAIALTVVFLWVMLPFLFYHPVKFMKRLFYVLGPAVVMLGIVTACCVGVVDNLNMIVNKSDWRSFLAPGVWNAAVTQALLSSQIAGGYLISAGDTVYASTNVKWTTLAFVGVNIVSVWGGVLFWYTVSGFDKDTSMFAVLLEAYQLGEEKSVAWALIVFATLCLSGVITVMHFAYPVFDRCRRIGGVKWRVMFAGVSIVGAALSLAALAGRLPALHILVDIAVPLLISLATVLEILAFIFIYGWRVLMEDVEFLIDTRLSKFWVLGWCASPGIIVPLTGWWVTMEILQDNDWTHPPWTTITVVVTIMVTFVMLVVFAVVSVVKQVQYDCVGKLMSSLQPSRHWGPRDPITHYYWLARREEVDRGNQLRTRYHRRELGQLSGRPSFLNVNTISEADQSNVEKQRSHSDDWLYTIGRRQKKGFLELAEIGRRRAKSLDCTYSNAWRKIDVNSKMMDIVTNGSFKSAEALSSENNNMCR